jgi:hypothetical protein
LDDIYLCQPGGLPNRLFIQQSDGTAKDTSAAAGVDWWDQSFASLLVDLDNDGDRDLVVGTIKGMIFMANDGSGKFSVVASKLNPTGPIYSLCAADFDGDGDLDVYGCCYAPDQDQLKGSILARPVPFHDANNGARNALFRNEGNWQFRNVTTKVGLDVNNTRFSYAASWEDYDNDGDQDLYVANDYGRNNLYRNDGGRFVDVAAELGVEDSASGMSVSWGDYNNDGWMDVYIGNMWSSAGNRITNQPAFQSGANRKTRDGFRRFARGNSLFQNAGVADSNKFQDVSLPAGVALGRWAWASKFVDINNDGWQDIYIVNGFLTQENSSDL